LVRATSDSARCSVDARKETRRCVPRDRGRVLLGAKRSDGGLLCSDAGGYSVLVLAVGQEWASPDGQSVVRVIEVSSERSVVERVLRPGSGKAGGHIHRDWTQRFEVREGEVMVRVGSDAARVLVAGETVEVPRGVGHVDPWNESAAPAVTRNIISPVTPFVHVIFATLGESLAAGRLDSQDSLTLLQMAAALRAGRADSWGEQPPIPVQRVVLPILAAIAKAGGFRPAPA
jgi:quercetin dioxygenase-like cupin family protein